VRMIIVMVAAFLFCVSADAQECFRTSVLTPTPLMGNQGEIFRTAEGDLYEVVGSYEYLYAYYPNVTICPSRGKMLVEGKTVGIVAAQTTGRQPPVSSKAPAPKGRGVAASITIVFRKRGCDYFLADGPRGLYILEWYGGHDPDRGDGILGDIDGYGFKDVLYTGGADGRVYVEEYLLSKDRALEELAEKCR